MAALLRVVILMMVVSMLVDTHVVKNPPPRPPGSTPLPTTTCWVTTLPPGCRTHNGHQLFPGQEIMFIDVASCQTCSCSFAGSVSCYMADCLIPMCVDSHRRDGACCATCPNGKNCRIPMTGEVISAGQPEERDGMLCECPPQNYALPGIQSEADYTAICIPVTTIPNTTPPVPVGRR